ncbi:MAG: tryptophan-rich sensory protein [Actinomycetes bacterium]
MPRVVPALRRRSSVVAAVGFVAVVVVYAVLARVLVDADSAWASIQPTPPWQPPDWVFGVAWPLNFLVLAVVGVVLARADARRAWPVLGVLALSVVCSLGWAALFHGPHALWPAAVALAMSSLLTWVVLLMASRVVWWTGLALAPYALWLTLSVSLAFWYADNL